MLIWGGLWFCLGSVAFVVVWFCCYFAYFWKMLKGWMELLNTTHGACVFAGGDSMQTAQLSCHL